MIKIKEIWIHLRSSFWFVPSLMLSLSIFFACILIEIDNKYTSEWSQTWPRLFGASADASRGMLSTIASSMMSMMTVSFSMTLVTLALASSQYTSRILRNFMRSRTTQVVLGVFAGVFTYCLIVMRTIRGADNNIYIPSVAVMVGFLLAVVSVGVLVFFIHHIASSIQASSIIASASEETIKTIQSLYSKKIDEKTAVTMDKKAAPQSMIFRKHIYADESGYIQNLDEGEIIKLAEEWKTVIKMNYRIGEFVIYGTPLVSLLDEVEINEEKINELSEAFSISRFRTIEQDPLFGIRQMVDIALKALSPGVNDTTTAVMCIDYLTTTLAHLSQRKIPSALRYKKEELRLICKDSDYELFLNQSFGQIRNVAKGNMTIIKSLYNSIEVLRQLNQDPLRDHLLSVEEQKITEVAKQSLEFSYDKAGLGSKLKQENDIYRFS